ncbi:MAG: leucine-rich repeat-containing protein kinase family protein [Pseudomonadota bacterium]
MTLQTLEALRAGRLAGASELKLACGLTQFPPEILTLADTLEVLDLSGNALDTLPDELAQLHRLRIIFCSNNRFTRLPDLLGRCAALSMVGFKANRIVEVPAASLPAQLRWLILTDNAVEALPAEIGHCAQLQKLMLAGNRLRELPESLRHCHRLELLRLAANRLESFPRWLLDLPRLAWLATAGNPFSADHEAATLAALDLPAIPWSAIETEALLGEGASGVIHRAQLRLQGAAAEPVAVKLFKGAVTSDGLPQSEMTAALHAGRHEGLIPLRGQVVGHPASARGLVMDLISPAFRNLAGPPSYESCTRDVYPDALRFDAVTLLRLVQGLASAAAHLHRRGVLHGDLYAHNILFDDAGQSLIGDFGAASLYAADGGALAIGLQRIEVQAFGILLGELLALGPAAWPARPALAKLQAACCADDPTQRPTFDDILLALSACTS